MSLYEYRATIVSVYDADTITVDIDLGFYVWHKKQPIRLYGINAWEVRGEEKAKGIIARDAVREFVKEYGPEVIIKTYAGKEKEKYGRWLADVRWEASDDHPELELNSWLVLHGHAVVNFYD